MSLRDLTSGSCAGGTASGASRSATGGPLSSLAGRVVDGTGPGLLAPGSSAARVASDVSALVHGSLNTSGVSASQEFALPSSQSLPTEFAGMPLPPPPAALPVPPPNLPPFFPPDFLRPFSSVPEPDPHAVTAEFEAAFRDAQPYRPAPLPYEDPLVRAQRDRTRQLYPGADDAFVEHHVRQFMADLAMHGRPPVGPELWKPIPPLHAVHQTPLQFLYPSAFHPGAGAPQSSAPARSFQFATNEGPRNATSVGTDASVAEHTPVQFDNAVAGNGADTALRDSVFQEFMELLNGGDNVAASTSQIGSPVEQYADLTEEKTELDDFEARALHTLSGAQRSWGDEFTSLEGLTASSSIAEQQFGESWQDPAEKPYAFEKENEFTGRSAAEALAEGERLRDEGQLARALDAFEVAVNRPVEDPHPPLEEAERARAWLLLGTTHAECDDDVRAIQALSRVAAVEPAPGATHDPTRTHAAALLALAVSYTNELDLPRAFVHMRRWLNLQKRIWGDADAMDSELADTVNVDVDDDGDVAAYLLRRLRDAASKHPEDVEVHIALGVLHSLTREYEQATAAFRCAVSMRKEDARLWNKLGATLANGGESDDALRAYRRAVDICPTYTRAWVNVGTAYGNRGEYGKAVRYYLRALAATLGGDAETRERRKTPQDDMGHVWGYLRSALYTLDMPELVPYAEERNLEAFRSHFQF